MRLTITELRNLIKESIVGRPIIYCDMDGVVADFVKGAIREMNKLLDEASMRPIESYESKTIRSAIRKVHRDLGVEYRVPATTTDIKSIKAIKRLSYAVISRDPGLFFLNLPDLVDGVSMLWPYITSLGLEVNMLSAPITSNRGMPPEEGKRLWVQNSLQPQPTEVYIVPAVEKQNFAMQPDGTPNILIDDKPETIQEWNAAGGMGILHVTGQSQNTILTLQSLGF